MPRPRIPKQAALSRHTVLLPPRMGPQAGPSLRLGPWLGRKASPSGRSWCLDPVWSCTPPRGKVSSIRQPQPLGYQRSPLPQLLKQVLVPERGGSTGEEGCAGCFLKVQAPADQEAGPRALPEGPETQGLHSQRLAGREMGQWLGHVPTGSQGHLEGSGWESARAHRGQAGR